VLVDSGAPLQLQKIATANRPECSRLALPRCLQVEQAEGCAAQILRWGIGQDFWWWRVRASMRISEGKGVDF
jgi:hypothetical protein